MKNKQINIRVSESQIMDIRKKSAQCKMTMTEYILSTISNSKIIIINDLIETQRQLRYIGNNLNQLTKLCHEGRIKCLDLSDIKMEVGKIWQSLNLLTQNQNLKH